MKTIHLKSEELRKTFTDLIERDTAAFNKVMEAFSLPKETDDQKALRTAAIQEATKEATLVPLRVMKHILDGLALAKVVAEKGNANSVSDAGVSALMLYAAAEGASLNVQINLSGINDAEFVGWNTDEMHSILRSCKVKAEEIRDIIRNKMTPS
jgi:formiminotetrahydrofolate cyclodeaminase